MKRSILLTLLGLSLLSGCATVISEETRKLVDPAVTFDKLREKPDSYLGKNVMVGGRIVAARNTKEGAVLEIVQLNLTQSGLPEDSFQSAGRFLATSVDFLDPSFFKPGRRITLVGEIKGKRTMPLDAIDYTYPVIAIREYYLWKDPDYGLEYFPPTYPYHDPAYFGPGGDYFNRPQEPVLKRWQ
jgi:outer membrane lipoprotein